MRCWTGGVLSGPWKVWLSHGFPAPGKFPQRRSAVPLSARNTGPWRETQRRLCQIPPWDGRRRDRVLKNSCFLLCVINTWKKHTHLGDTGHTQEDSGALNEASEWKEGQLSMCLFWQEGVRAEGEVCGEAGHTEMERWERKGEEKVFLGLYNPSLLKTKYQWGKRYSHVLQPLLFLKWRRRRCRGSMPICKYFDLEGLVCDSGSLVCVLLNDYRVSWEIRENQNDCRLWGIFKYTVVWPGA